MNDNRAWDVQHTLTVVLIVLLTLGAATTGSLAVRQTLNHEPALTMWAGCFNDLLLIVSVYFASRRLREARRIQLEVKETIEQSHEQILRQLEQAQEETTRYIEEAGARLDQQQNDVIAMLSSARKGGCHEPS